MRVVIEKPFGTDLASARKLQGVVSSVFRERQVFRIDHYLGKETVQNLLAFRFANHMFEPVWNRNYIDHVQITAAEDIGIGSRAGYYDSSGALRDLVQNHMLQLLTLLCMEPPSSFEADKVRDEKVKVLRRDPAADAGGRGGDDRARAVHGGLVRRRGGPGLPRRGRRAGRLPDRDLRGAAARGAQLALGGRADLPAHGQAAGAQGRPRSRSSSSRCRTWRSPSEGSVGVQPNQLILTVQPNEGVSLSLGAKIPGASMRIRPVNMEFLYGTSFMSQSPEAYERLILDAMRGEATLFTRNDEVDAQWSIIDPILQAWKEGQPPHDRVRGRLAGPVRGRRADRAARVAGSVIAP